MGLRQLVSAAARYSVKIAKRKSGNVDTGWQDDAWKNFKSVPEVRFAGTWVGSAMGGATLIAGRRTDAGAIEPAPDDHLASQIVREIAGGPDGQSAMLEDFGPQLVVAGEGWLIIRPVIDETGEVDSYEWLVRSTREVSQKGAGKLVAEIDGEEVQIPPYDPDAEQDPTDPIAIRVWKPSPDRHIEADSPVRSSLGLLEELQLLNAAVAAIARSRITGRGVLLVPKGTRFPTAPGQAGNAQDDVLEVFLEVASTAIREPDSAAATVPIILEVAAETISDIKWLSFESNFDELALKLREEAIRRFANGLEIPAEILLGLADANHWSAWAISAEAVRVGAVPRLQLVCHALTTRWLRPLLKDAEVEDADDWLVWYDTSQLRVQANRPQTALEAFNAGLISATAARRETGFDETDAPETPNPPKDAPDLDPEDAQDPADEETPSDVTSLPVGETTSIPDTLPAAAVVPHPSLDAVDGLIWAALQTAGERLRNKPACPRSERARARDIQPAELHTLYPVEADMVDGWHLLDGAWVRVPEIARRYGLDPECLTDVLDDYARALIAARLPHTYEDTMRVLHAPCLAKEAA
ncbi:hypothetical protein ACFXJ6_07925 [Streptomyces sp. NPDC059218]|uniref:hypothetical protein n=1 Tax=unclassified Streptomyces TaxID=2593676 RepID=UPI0036C5D46B